MTYVTLETQEAMHYVRAGYWDLTLTIARECGGFPPGCTGLLPALHRVARGIWAGSSATIQA